MYRLIKFFLAFTIIVVATSCVYAQSNSKLCILFDENSKYIDMNTSKDSMSAAFNIVMEGYETEEKRKKAKREWAKREDRVAGGPHFYYNFFSVNKPIKIKSIKSLTECVAIVTVDEFRQDEFSETNNISDALVFFIKKLPNGSFLKWEAGLMLQM